jgi:DNA-binding beta-propeller fold protein YncE
MKRTLTLAVSTLAALVWGGGDAWATPWLFGSEVGDDVLVTIDPATAAGSVVGPQAGSEGAYSITGLALDPLTQTLYGIQSRGTIDTINPRTGVSTVLDTVASGGNSNGLAFDSSQGILYYSDNNTNSLYYYDPSSTNSGLVAAITGGYSGVEGLAYDPATDTLYGLADSRNQIVTIDKKTGAAVALLNPLSGGTWRGLTFHPGTGMLYATRIGSMLTEIDPLTGIGTDVGTITSVGRFVQGLAIPEPGTLALTLLGLGGLAAQSRRRNRAARCRDGCRVSHRAR